MMDAFHKTSERASERKVGDAVAINVVLTPYLSWWAHFSV